jgi:peptidoglycan/LPS O-acetylase OafA/YrhL
MIRWIAGGTFSLYLVHLPVMHFLAAVFPWASDSSWTLAVLVGVTPMVCYAFAEVTERRKNAWRNLILKVLNKGYK